MTLPAPELERLSTGSAAFDSILGGGLPVRSLTVIAGEPGSGKTLFTLQTLFHLARQGKKCLYFTTLSEPSLKLLHHMQKFAFFDVEAIGKQLVFVDLGSVIRGQDSDAALEAITSRVDQEEPVMVVIDSFKALREVLGEAPSLRLFIYDLAVHIAGWGAATLFVGEYTDDEVARFSEFAIADGILRFSYLREELTAVRTVEVLKLRGADCVMGRHFFEISASGLTFFPRVQSPKTPGNALQPSSSEPASTGIPGLDAMLGGGLPRSSSTVVEGGTGTGKTLLGLTFLLEGARLEEPGIHFTLEESPGQLHGAAQVFGWDMRAYEARGLISICHVSPVELATDAFLNQALQLVKKVGARRAVLDSLTSMALGVRSERRYKELAYAMAQHFRSLGVTFIMNMEIPELLGSAQLSGHGVSFAADNVLQIKYVELDGQLQRGISVLKARGIRHATEVRGLTMNEHGIAVGGPFKGLRGVLTGMPTPL